MSLRAGSGLRLASLLAMTALRLILNGKMHFTFPQALYLLALIPLIILIHTLRLKRRKVAVTTSFLWEEVLEEHKRRFSFHRFVSNLPLIFQILAVGALSVGLAHPVLNKGKAREGNIVLIMDTSASMQAKGQFRSRFEEARDKALELIENLAPENQMVILEAGPKPLLKTFLTSDKDLLRRIVKTLKPTDGTSSIEDALKAGLSFVNKSEQDLVYVLTDGAFSQFEGDKLVSGRIQYEIIPGDGNNVGVSRFEVRKIPNTSQEYEIMLVLHNFGDHPFETVVNLFLSNREVLSQMVKLEGHEERLLFYSYEGIITGPLEVEISVEDHFSVDNRAYVIPSPADDVWVLVVGEENYFLDSLLASYPMVQVNHVKEISPESLDQQLRTHDLVIFNGINPPPLTSGSVVLINTSGTHLPFEVSGKMAKPTVTGWNPNHPLMQRLNLTDLYIEEAFNISLKGEGESILFTENHPLIWALEKGSLRLIYIGFDLMKSDLPLKAAFPILMGNILHWLYPEKLETTFQQVQVGHPYQLHLVNVPTEVKVKKPDRQIQKFRVTENLFSYEGTDQVGIYTLTVGNQRRIFAVNLTDEEESNIRSRFQPPRPDLSNVSTSPILTQIEEPWWGIFLLVAILLVIGEWWVWCKLG